MFQAYGWVIARSARLDYVNAEVGQLDAIDERVRRADEVLFLQLEAYLRSFQSPDLDWHFRPQFNNVCGVLTLVSSCNHRGDPPSILEVLYWLAQHGPDSYGIVYVHDDEDSGSWAQTRGRSGTDLTNAFRVWRLCRGSVEEHDDPFLSPIVPVLDAPFG